MPTYGCKRKSSWELPQLGMYGWRFFLRGDGDEGESPLDDSAWMGTEIKRSILWGPHF